LYADLHALPCPFLLLLSEIHAEDQSHRVDSQHKILGQASVKSEGGK
jgi:hypothetical protein